MANADLITAKEAKKDEFYTDLADIQVEMSNYTDKFINKVVLCNCDDPFESNFVKYFLMNFNRLGLKELIATGYKTSSIGGSEIGEANTPYVLRVKETKKYLVGTQKDLDIRGAKYFLETEGNSVMMPLIGNTALDENGKQIQVTVKEPIMDDNGNPILDKKGKQKTRTVKQDLYYEAGDFRSDMSLTLLKECDIVVTNPPFSLFREFVSLLVKYKKQFLIIGNVNAITYKEIFPLIRSNELWFGPSISSGDRKFYVPDNYSLNASNCGIDKNGHRFIRVKGVRWFTNIDHAKRHQILPLDLGFVYEGHEDMYPKYDNYNAINVDKTAEIPSDYMGVMGVPITFLDKYCPEQFEIVAFRKGDDGKDLVFTREREREFNHTFVSLYDLDSRDDKKCRRKNQWKTYLCQNNDTEKIIEPIDYFYPSSMPIDGCMNNPKDTCINGCKKYARVLIKRKEL